MGNFCDGQGGGGGGGRGIGYSSSWMNIHIYLNLVNLVILVILENLVNLGHQNIPYLQIDSLRYSPLGYPLYLYLVRG